jgi:hypothetical protein
MLVRIQSEYSNWLDRRSGSESIYKTATRKCLQALILRDMKAIISGMECDSPAAALNAQSLLTRVLNSLFSVSNFEFAFGRSVKLQDCCQNFDCCRGSRSFIRRRN